MRNVVKIVLVLVLLIGTQATVSAQSGKMTLRQTLEYAVKNSHQTRNAELDEREASGKVKEIRSAALPQVNGGVNFNYNPAIAKMMMPGEMFGEPGKSIPVEFGLKYDGGASVQLSQVIFNPALFTGIKVARSAEELMALKSRMTQEQLIYDVASIYYNILHTQQQLKRTVENLSLQDSIYRMTELKTGQDLVREIDLNRIKVGITGLKVIRDNLEYLVEQQTRYLAVLIGYPLDEPIETDDSEIAVLNADNRILDTAGAPLQRTELEFIEQQQRMNRLEEKTIKWQYSPSLSLIASGGFQYMSDKIQFNNNDNWFKTAFIGASLSIPIFDGGSKYHQVKQIKLQRAKLENDLKLTQQSIKAEQKNAIQELMVAHKSVLAQEENVRLAENIYHQSYLLYESGLYNVTDLLQTDDALREAQTAHLFEVIRFKKAALDLKKAEGRLNELIEN